MVKICLAAASMALDARCSSEVITCCVKLGQSLTCAGGWVQGQEAAHGDDRPHKHNIHSESHDEPSTSDSAQDYSSYRLPDAAVASAASLRDQPLASTASAESANLPKDASVGSLRCLLLPHLQNKSTSFWAGKSGLMRLTFRYSPQHSAMQAGAQRRKYCIMRFCLGV